MDPSFARPVRSRHDPRIRAGGPKAFHTAFESREDMACR